jgi:hypothetical protein
MKLGKRKRKMPDDKIGKACSLIREVLLEQLQKDQTIVA